ncbi:Reduced meiotic recombination protein 1 [Candida viswanathii]|uniref:Reduced meiotic recombination protein 1 n=1 Tax=Candida viswanathii TaxID=5486 RepID=A0A367YMD6_9ASCO|nr:Reduced meiotic recombination protein 1 [Candida viswanathii]
MTDTQPATDVLSNEVRLDDEHEVTEDGLFIIDQGSNGSGHTSGTIDINKNRSQDKEEEEEELTYDDDEYVINQDNSSDDDFEGEEKSEAVEEDDDEVAVVLEVSKDDGEPEVLEVSEVKHEEEPDQDEPDQEEKPSEDQQLANPELKAIPEIGTLKDVSTEEQAREESIEIIINEDDEKSDYAETSREYVDDIEMIPQLQQTEQKSTEHEINEDLDDVITLTEDPEFAQPTESATTTTTVTTTAIDDHKIPIYLTYSEHKFLLFPFEREQDLPYIFEDFDQCYKPIEDFFVDIRENHQFNEIEPILVSEELILTIPQFESLRMTEDNVYCRDISISDFVNLFKRLSDATKDKTKVPSHLTFELTTQPRFITKYNSLVDDSQDTTNGGFDQIDNNEEPELLEEEGDDEPITKKRRIE